MSELNITVSATINGYGILPGIEAASYEMRTQDMVGSRIQVRDRDGSSHVQESTARIPDREIASGDVCLYRCGRCARDTRYYVWLRKYTLLLDVIKEARMVWLNRTPNRGALLPSSPLQYQGSGATVRYIAAVFSGAIAILHKKRPAMRRSRLKACRPGVQIVEH